MSMSLESIRSRLYASGLHLAVSLVVAGLAAWLVFGRWYPAPFAALAGATSLFPLLVSVDVVMGPALTFVIASPSKPKAELIRDLAVVGVLQLSALAYGLHAVSLARPVALVFEIDLFRLVTAADIEPAALGEAPPELRDLSWTGPRLMAAVKPADPKEQLRTIDLGMAGIALASLPRYWRSYESQSAFTWQSAKPIQALIDKYPHLSSNLTEMASRASQPPSSLRFLPLTSRRETWTAVVAGPQARIVGYLPVDGFL